MAALRTLRKCAGYAPGFCCLRPYMLSVIDTDRVIEMAWEDRTPFEAIELQFGLLEKDVIALMRRELKGASFRRWRKRVNSGVSMKHAALRSESVKRFKSPMQRVISRNRISKR